MAGRFEWIVALIALTLQIAAVAFIADQAVVVARIEAAVTALVARTH